jgi:hypothetical protein
MGQGIAGNNLAEGEMFIDNVIHDQFGSGHCLHG